MKRMFTMPAGQVATIAARNGSGHVRREDDATIGAIINETTPATFGPYAQARNFVLSGDATVTIADAATDAAAIVAAVPVADQDDSVTVWNNAGVLQTSTAPGP